MRKLLAVFPVSRDQLRSHILVHISVVLDLSLLLLSQSLCWMSHTFYLQYWLAVPNWQRKKYINNHRESLFPCLVRLLLWFESNLRIFSVTHGLDAMLLERYCTPCGLFWSPIFLRQPRNAALHFEQYKIQNKNYATAHLLILLLLKSDKSDFVHNLERLFHVSCNE